MKTLALLLIPGLSYAAEELPQLPAVNIDPTATGGLSEMILKYIVVPLLPVLGAALIAGVGFFARWIHTRTEQMRFAQAIATATDLVDSVVRNLEASMRPMLAKALQDGHLTQEEAAIIKAEALKQVLAALPAWAARLLEGTLGPAINTWVGGQIERAHANLTPPTPQ